MITSLLKIASITILSCIFPLNEGASSSYLSAQNKNFLSREVAPSFRSSIVESCNSYWEYDSSSDWYFEISSSDISYGHYSNFTSTAFSGSYRIVYDYLYEDIYHSGTAQMVSYVNATNCLYVYTDASNRICLDLNNGSMYSQNTNTMTINYNIYSLRLHYYNASPYYNFIYDLIDYSIQFAEPYVFTPYQLNYFRFFSLADFIYDNQNYFDSYSHGRVGENDYSSSTKYECSSTEWGDFDGSNVIFHLNGDFKGMFESDYVYMSWNQPLYIYLPNGNIRDSFIELANSTITSSDSNIYVEYFDFKYDFNYNAPYSNTINQMFVQDSTFTSTNPTAFVLKIIDLPYFVSNGGLYNQIYLYYFNGYGTRYNSGVDRYDILNQAGYGYFNTMVYRNSDADYSKLVYTRLFSQYTDSDGDLQTYLSVGGTWENTAYQHLDFIHHLSLDDKDSLAKFNNGSYDNGISNNYNFFGSSFSLIDTAFKGLASLLSVQVLPNVSLGVLIITPFIIGILLFVVALFKR